MKAWIVYYGDQWCVLIHADTRGKAKARAMALGHGDEDFVQYSARRIPALDGKPFTYETAENAGFHYLDDYDGVPIQEDEFYNDCKCDICKMK